MNVTVEGPKLVDGKPRLTVVGVGGAGCNAVNNMIAAGLQGVEFVVANTDAQSLAASSAEHRVQLGTNLTEGLGAGSRPEIGEAAAEEALDDIRRYIAGSHMVFIAAGMGGGTGTGAAAVVARLARETGALTVGIVCKPFQFEGTRRMRIAEAGIQALRHQVDTLIVIPNQNLFRIANARTTFAEAFVLADQVLYSGVACVVELVLKEGLINLDFADVRSVMSGMGTAMMGTGEASGEGRAVAAAEEAIANPLLDDVTLKGAKGLLLSITGGSDLTLFEVDEAASRIREEVDDEANIIVGATFDDSLGDRLRVSIVASGMGSAAHVAPLPAVSTYGAAPSGQPQPGAFHPHPAPQTLGIKPISGGQGAIAPAETQRRLSEVLQSAEPAPVMAPTVVAGSGQPTGEGDLEGQIERSRKSWSAPNNVTIEESDGYFTATQPAPAAAYEPNNGYSEPHRGQGFIPQAPQEFPRGGRRMPTVEDFPPIAQQEWHARQRGQDGSDQARHGRSAPSADHGQRGHNPEPERRSGLLSKLSGLGRR